MAIQIIRGGSDPIIGQIVTAMQAYERDHPQAQIDIYRQNSVSIRIRIVDPTISDMDRPERQAMAWRYLEELPEEVQSDVTMLLLLTPEETRSSFANIEFEDPIPSAL